MPRGVYTRQLVTVICENPVCRMPFTARKGGQPRRWCSDSCKQAGYRLRKWKAAQEPNTGL